MGGDAEAGVTHDDGVCGATVHGFPTEAEFLARLDVGASGIDGGGVDERELVGRDVVFLGDDVTSVSSFDRGVPCTLSIHCC